MENVESIVGVYIYLMRGDLAHIYCRKKRCGMRYWWRHGMHFSRAVGCTGGF